MKRRSLFSALAGPIIADLGIGQAVAQKPQPDAENGYLPNQCPTCKTFAKVTYCDPLDVPEPILCAVDPNSDECKNGVAYEDPQPILHRCSNCNGAFWSDTVVPPARSKA